MLHAEQDPSDTFGYCSLMIYFNPLAPCGARRANWNKILCGSDFNPLAPCGARRLTGERIHGASQFQSTCSVRSKTRCERKPLTSSRFQSTCSVRSKTHCPAERVGNCGYFNPLAPCGARRWMNCRFRCQCRFQSTCSVRSKTAQRASTIFCYCISIHLLRAEQDVSPSKMLSAPCYFNPLAPCGARHQPSYRMGGSACISIHLLRAEQDGGAAAVRQLAGKISIHLLRAEQDFNELAL